MLSSCPKDVILAPTDFRRGIFLSVDCLKRRRYAALVGLGRPSAWDEGEARITSPPVRQPARCREHGTYGGQGKAVGCVPPTALLFVESRSFFIEMVTLAGLEPATSPVPRTLCPP